jgi:DNA-nicking Smr family endonuclease
MAKKPPKQDGPFAALGELKERLAREDEAKGRTGPAPHAAPKPAAPPRTTPEEDEHSFHRMISGVTPLEGQAARVPRTGSADAGERRLPRENPQARAAREADEVHEHLRRLVDDGARFESADDGTRVHGARAGAPADAIRRLRAGLVPVDHRLDVRGLTAERARAEIERALGAQRARGERCVAVRFGGAAAPGQMPVLRGEIAAWLSQGPGREHVAAFASTADAGDAPEVLVLLRA